MLFHKIGKAELISPEVGRQDTFQGAGQEKDHITAARSILGTSRMLLGARSGAEEDFVRLCGEGSSGQAGSGDCKQLRRSPPAVSMKWLPTATPGVVTKNISSTHGPTRCAPAGPLSLWGWCCQMAPICPKDGEWKERFLFLTGQGGRLCLCVLSMKEISAVLQMWWVFAGFCCQIPGTSELPFLMLMALGGGGGALASQGWLVWRGAGVRHRKQGQDRNGRPCWLRGAKWSAPGSQALCALNDQGSENCNSIRNWAVSWKWHFLSWPEPTPAFIQHEAGARAQCVSFRHTWCLTWCCPGLMLPLASPSPSSASHGRALPPPKCGFLKKKKKN